MTSDLVRWALPRFSKLLPLDEESLKQIITYTDTLPKDAAAEHLKNLLGDSPQAFEFISSFNSHRQAPPSSNAPVPRTQDEAPRARPRQAKKKPNIHELPARQINNRGDTGGGYVKPNETDYMAARSKPQRKEPPLANALALNDQPDAAQLPLPESSATARTASSRPPPSASGPLISDALESKKSSRTASPAPKTKITIQGGQAMHGASSALSDLDSAIRSLEVQTNPTLTTSTFSAEDNAKRRCPCMATRHPLLTIAPNCMNCGKIICVKEGLGPCTYCHKPLLSSEEVSSVLRVLKDERGKERQATNNATHKRAEVSTKPKAFSGRDFLSSSTSATSSRTASPLASDAEDSATNNDDRQDAAGLARAKQHRDRLLGFQAQNAKRTRIHDEAADYDVPVAGTNMWASPAERAMQLKRQQKVLREVEWNARPEWDKKKMVASIDVVGGRIVKKMVAADRPVGEDEGEGGRDSETPVEDGGADVQKAPAGGGAFSRNPLLGALIRPVARMEKGKDPEADVEREKRSVWRRVQDDRDDNEGIILDGGMYGGRTEGRILGAEEHAVGATAG